MTGERLWVGLLGVLGDLSEGGYRGGEDDAGFLAGGLNYIGWSGRATGSHILVLIFNRRAAL